MNENERLRLQDMEAGFLTLRSRVDFLEQHQVALGGSQPDNPVKKEKRPCTLTPEQRKEHHDRLMAGKERAKARREEEARAVTEAEKQTKKKAKAEAEKDKPLKDRLKVKA